MNFSSAALALGVLLGIVCQDLIFDLQRDSAQQLHAFHQYYTHHHMTKAPYNLFVLIPIGCVFVALLVRFGQRLDFKTTVALVAMVFCLVLFVGVIIPNRERLAQIPLGTADLAMLREISIQLGLMHSIVLLLTFVSILLTADAHVIAAADKAKSH